MTRIALLRIVVLLCLLFTFKPASQAQLVGPGIVDSATSEPASTRTISFSGTVPGQLDGSLSVIFAIYPDQQSASALWTETQVVQIAGEKYSVMLGSTSATGLPQDIFAADQAHWLGVQINGVEKRFLLVSVPYAMKAVEAERLGGLLPSDFVTVQQLQLALQNAASGTTAQPKSGVTVGANPTPLAAPAGTPPQPATDFTDNNASEVLLVTQQGTGFAIHAISNTDAAIFAENSSTTGTALKVVESSPTGLTTGILAQTASPDGIPGIFDNNSGGSILVLRNNGANVTTFNSHGDINTLGEILAGRYNGDGSGLLNIPPTAINATPGFAPNTVVLRDTLGGFSAGRIFGQFSGDGSGLFNIPPIAIGATPGFAPNSVVLRDTLGGFSAGQIFGQFSGDGSGLFNISPIAIGATPGLAPNSVVLRDGGGGFSAGFINASGLSASVSAGPAIHGDGGIGVQASTPSGIGLWAGANASDSTGTALLLSHASLGKLISGGVGTTTALANESFSLDAAGNISFNGGLMTPYETAGTWLASSLVKLTSDPGSSDTGTVTMTAPGDNAGAIGIITGLPSGSSKTQVAQSGQFFCNFDGPATAGHYVGISKTTAGDCADIGPIYPNDGQQIVGRVLSSLGPSATRILLFQSELHGSSSGGTGSGVTSVGAGDASIAIGGTPASPTIAVANGGITSAKLAPNAITSANIADGSLTPAKIAGTAATLGSNNFLGSQNMSSLSVTGFLNIQGFSNSFISTNNSSFTALQVTGGSDSSPAMVARGNFDAISVTSINGHAVLASSVTGVGVHGDGPEAGVEAQSTNIALSATASSGPGGAAGVFTQQGSGNIITGLAGALPGEVFNVDASGNLLTSGNILSFGGLTIQYPNGPTGTVINGPVKLTPNGFAIRSDAGDLSGVIGIAVAGAGATGNVQIAYSGRVFCKFDNVGNVGNYAGISRSQPGMCSDLGPSGSTSGQIIGRIIAAPQGVVTPTGSSQVLLFGTEDRGGTVSVINTGAGLTGGPITGSGFISIANGGVTNAMLQNPFVSVTPGVGLSGGGTGSLGGNITLTNAGALSFNGRTGSILAAPGDYSFSQIAGTATALQLPANTVFNNQNNTFTADQAIQGNVSATGNVNANAVTAASANFSGTAGSTSVLAVNDNGTSGFSFAVNSAHNPAALFTSSGGTVLLAGPITGPTTILSTAGDLTLNGTATAHAFSGNGSALTNVNAASVGGVAVANLATTSALGAETAARQSGDTTLQSNINAESSARASADTTLQNNINAETAARASTDSSLQANINAVSSASAQLAAANTFAAKQTLAASSASAASLNVPAGATPSAPAPGDIWNTGTVVQFRDTASTTRSLVSTTQSGGLQLLKLTASATLSNVSSQVCTEQTFTVTGINTGDVLLSVLQPSTSSPGVNIAIGGFRITAANTVAVQFCNVGKNNSTPTSGVYTFAFMR